MNGFQILGLQVFKTHGSLLSVLIIMLPCLEELYLGSSVMASFPFFRNILPKFDTIPSLRGLNHAIYTPQWDHPNLSCLMVIMGAKLTSLELPIDFRLVQEETSCIAANVNGIPVYFPELKRLILPSYSVVKVPCKNVIPPKLEVLILTAWVRYELNGWLISVAQAKKQHFPRLTQIHFHNILHQTPAGPNMPQIMAAAGVVYVDHLPIRKLPMGREYFHP